jgi:hypothetical protein
MENSNFRSSFVLNIARVSVVIIGMCFMGGGCKDPMTPQEVVNSYAGTWQLSSTTYGPDSIFVHKVQLIFYKDSTFKCNASFFLRRDSLKSSPCNGTWGVSLSTSVPFLTNHPNPDRIGLQSSNFLSSWDIWGNVSSGSMLWVNDSINYNWSYVK